MGRMLLLVAMLIAFLDPASSLYEEPPGGCAIPAEYDGANTVKKPPQRRSPPPTTQPESQLSEEEVQTQLERELYERESMAQLAGLGAEGEADDWDQVERDHQRELATRELLKNVALACLITYALYISLQHVRNLARAGAASDGEVPPKPDSAQAAAAAGSGQALPTGVAQSPKGTAVAGDNSQMNTSSSDQNADDSKDD
mmetsp:Transcript_23574/g.60253  ORF Transcript_23574/g.60253 Transcript_23574/m.60253 type:complete len:200 (+) Transcript_23574:34-633(+)